MQLINTLKTLAGVGMVCVASLAHAKYGVDPKDIKYQQWSQGRPTSYTIISGTIDGPVFTFGSPLQAGVNWVDQDDHRQLPVLSKLCSLDQPPSRPCGSTLVHGHVIREAYIGPPEGMRISGGEKTKRFALLSPADLEVIPPGVKKVLLVNIQAWGWVRQALTAVYDDSVSDDDLRTLMLEDGVLRVYQFRED